MVLMHALMAAKPDFRSGHKSLGFSRRLFRLRCCCAFALRVSPLASGADLELLLQVAPVVDVLLVVRRFLEGHLHTARSQTHEFNQRLTERRAVVFVLRTVGRTFRLQFCRIVIFRSRN